MITAAEILDELMAEGSEAQARQLLRFFKCGPGEYGEGDRFLGLKNPQTRAIVRLAGRDVPLDEIEKLLYSEWHEARLCGFLLLVEQMKAALPRKKDVPTRGAERREELAAFYLKHARQANNWDLVDLSCPKILGEWLAHPRVDGELPSTEILDRLAASTNLWEQRIAMVTTWRLIRDGRFDETLRLARTFLSHPHDLIHKATGWMLREVGKQDEDVLRVFLDENYARMPRTALRYAIERMSEPERKYWLTKKS